MHDMRPISTRTQHKPSYVHPDLNTASHVFIRDDTVRKSLQPPYQGPFPVLRRTDKFFVIERYGKRDNVSIDRVKPAYLEREDHPPPSSSPSTHTALDELTDTPLPRPPPTLHTPHPLLHARPSPQHRRRDQGVAFAGQLSTPSILT